MSKQQFRIWFNRNGVEGCVYITADDPSSALDLWTPSQPSDRVVMVEAVL